MNKLSLAIEKAILECRNFGAGEVKLGDDIKIQAEWEEYDENHDIIVVYIYQNDVVKFKYKVKETIEYI